MPNKFQPKPHILIVEDDEAYGSALQKTLINIQKKILCIGQDKHDAVRWDKNAFKIIKELDEALTAAHIGEAGGFKDAVAKLPKVIVLDQFLPSPEEPNYPTLVASKKVQELVNQIWGAVQANHALTAAGWKGGVIHHTSEPVKVNVHSDEQSRSKSWVKVCHKPSVIHVNNAALEIVKLCNHLTGSSGEKKPQNNDHALFAGGATGRQLLNSVNEANNLDKPIWLHVTRTSDASVFSPLLKRTAIALDPIEMKNQNEFNQWLKGLASANAASFHTCKLNLTDLNSHETQQIININSLYATRFLIASNQPCPNDLTLLFSTVSPLALHTWPEADLKSAALAKSKTTNVQDFADLYKAFQAIELCYAQFEKIRKNDVLTVDNLKSRIPLLGAEAINVEVSGVNTKKPIASVQYGSNSIVLQLRNAPDICALAVLLSANGHQSWKLPISDIPKQFEQFEGNQFHDKTAKIYKKITDSGNKEKILKNNFNNSENSENYVQIQLLS
jgi:hypothetical protein